MRKNSKWMLTTIAFVVISLTTTQLEPIAFGMTAEESANPEPRAAEAPAPAVSSDAQLRASVAALLAAPPAQTPTAAAGAQATRLPAVPSSTPSNGKSHTKKWIVIAAIIGAGVTTAIIVLNKSDEPTVTVGALTVGQPQ